MVNRITGEPNPLRRGERGIQSRFDINGHGILRLETGRQPFAVAAGVASARGRSWRGRITEAEQSIRRRPRGRRRARVEAFETAADNLVERPWGGAQLREFKRLGVAAAGAGAVGESFEIAADDTDDEARRYPSVVELGDGSTVTLPALLARHAETLLGAAFVARYGPRFPLLPKLLDVAELLSIQAHPPGNTEVYVIVAAEPGATIRLGFRADVDATAFAASLAQGRRDQQRVLELCAGAMGAGAAADAAETLARGPRRNSGNARARAAAAAAAGRELGRAGGVPGRVACRLLAGARQPERDSGGGGAGHLQRESGASRRGQRPAGLGRGPRARQPAGQGFARARDSSARGRRTERGTTCAFRCARSTSRPRSAR